MQPSDYVDLIDHGMALSKTEQKLIAGMPNPVAVGYISTRRKDNGGKRDENSSPDLGSIFGF